MNKLPLSDALRQLPTPAAPDAIWRRIEETLDGVLEAEPRPRSSWWRAWEAPSRGQGLALLAACCAALFLWFEALQQPQQEPQRPDSNVAEVNQNVLQLQQLSARLEDELKVRRARSTRYDDEVALREAMLAAALEDIDQALAVNTDVADERALWTQRVALLAGLNEQATDPLPLGRVDWVRVD